METHELFITLIVISILGVWGMVSIRMSNLQFKRRQRQVKEITDDFRRYRKESKAWIKNIEEYLAEKENE